MPLRTERLLGPHARARQDDDGDPEVSSSSAAIASSSSHDSNGSISPGRGSGFFTCTAGLSSIHFHRTAACKTWRNARWDR